MQAGGMTVLSGGLTVSADGVAAITAGATATDSALYALANSGSFKGSVVNMRAAKTAASDFHIYKAFSDAAELGSLRGDGLLEVRQGGLQVTAGGATVVSGTLLVEAGQTITTGGFHVITAGATFHDGGVQVGMLDEHLCGGDRVTTTACRSLTIKLGRVHSLFKLQPPASRVPCWT